MKRHSSRMLERYLTVYKKNRAASLQQATAPQMIQSNLFYRTSTVPSSPNHRQRTARALKDYLCRRKKPVRHKKHSYPKKTGLSEYKKIRRKAEFIVDHAKDMDRDSLLRDFNWIRNKIQSYFNRRFSKMYRFNPRITETISPLIELRYLIADACNKLLIDLCDTQAGRYTP